jgi:DNA-binding MltR family transcriptional regulator
MAKRDKTPPDVVSLRAAINRFTKQGDRGTALVATAWLDDALKECLRAVFRPDRAVADELLRADGPLGTFSARTKLVYLLDMVEPTARKDLDLIRVIRNDFAHRRDNLRFTTQSIRDRCRQLHGATACRLGGLMLRSPRQRFVVTAYFLAEYLMGCAKPRKRNALLDHADSYGSWIRRTVRSSTLALLAKEIENL